jgi:hypothetical protein
VNAECGLVRINPFRFAGTVDNHYVFKESVATRLFLDKTGRNRGFQSGA